jgi:uracil DNA glycosylase
MRATAFAMFSTTHNVLISICRCSGIDPKYNTMIKTSHPSPLGAYKTSSPFMGSKYGLFWL